MSKRVIRGGDYEFLLWEQSLQVHCGNGGNIWSEVIYYNRPITEKDIENLLQVLSIGEFNHKNKVRKAMAFLNG